MSMSWLGRRIRCLGTRNWIFRQRYYSQIRSIELLGKSYPTDEMTNITPSIIAKLPLKLHRQENHPLCTLKSLIEAHYADFDHISSLSPIVTTFQNFDELGFPKEHPGRAVTDTYYVNKDLLLRTHTSAHEVEVFREGKTKWLLTADVYRRDEIDKSHYPVFHQMEGARIFATDDYGKKEVIEDNARLSEHLARSNILIEDIPVTSPSNPVQPGHNPELSSLVAQNLKLSLNSLILHLFGEVSGATAENPLKVRWIEAYFPFTSPSYEVEVFFGGKWIEILGSGVVQRLTLDISDISGKIGWAFGLGLERIAMVLFSIPDIRLFWSTDPRFLSQFRAGQITTFQPYSKYPPCVKDLSFWIPSDVSLHDNDLCDLVRDIAGDWVESVLKIDSFIHPKTNRHSSTWRVNYRSMDSSLTNLEVNEVHDRIKERLTKKFRVEMR